MPVQTLVWDEPGAFMAQVIERRARSMGDLSQDARIEFQKTVGEDLVSYEVGAVSYYDHDRTADVYSLICIWMDTENGIYKAASLANLNATDLNDPWLTLTALM